MATGRALQMTKWGSNQVYLTSGLQDPMSAYTMSMWVHIDSGQSLNDFWNYNNSGDSDFVEIIQMSDPAFRIRDDTYTGVSIPTLAPSFDGTWYWIAIRYSSGTMKIWGSTDGGTIYSDSASLGAVSSPVRCDWGGGSGSGFDGAIGAIKVWHSALSDAEVEAERDYVKPVKAGAWAWYGMDSDTWSTCLTDNSGNGHTLQNTSAGTVVTGPPIDWEPAAAGGRNPVAMGFVLE